MWTENIILFIFGLCIAIIGYLFSDKISSLESEIEDLKDSEGKIVKDLMTEEKLLVKLQCSVTEIRNDLKQVHGDLEYLKRSIFESDR